MVDITTEAPLHERWAKRDYWYANDVVALCMGGLDHSGEIGHQDAEVISRKIDSGITAGHLKATHTNQGLQFKRDDIVKWASKNLPTFPFNPDDFSPVKKERKSGSDREETQLRMIGALALLVAQKSGKYKVGEKPNQSQIVTAVNGLLDHLQEESPNISGMGQANFRAAIKDGLAALLE